MGLLKSYSTFSRRLPYTASVITFPFIPVIHFVPLFPFYGSDATDDWREKVVKPYFWAIENRHLITTVYYADWSNYIISIRSQAMWIGLLSADGRLWPYGQEPA